jgi:(1->4)-alpha-D-glucan 1-alpha-D-glucosylmutase
MASNRAKPKRAGLPELAIDGKTIPRATYRIQFNRAFGFDQAAKLAPYLASLGISHVYCSPYLKARPGSAHGYDIISHTELNPELGDGASFERMVEAFRQNDLSQLLDFVPNHMGVGGADNPWWLDVLEWGRDSSFAGWFDIDWEPDQRHLHNKLLAPVLSEQYGAALESGALRLKFDVEAGAFAVWAYDTHKLPICPLDYQVILGRGHPELDRLGDAFAHLVSRDTHVASRAKDLRASLAREAARNPEMSAALDWALDRFAGVPGDLESWSRLHDLIHTQHWRPAHFRVAGDDINYRRFFDVNDLARIRMELPELFDHGHALVFRLLADGVIDGLRIDHIDGLLDPRKYCLQLRGSAPRPFYLVVEKILARHEDIRDDWNVDGATGYEVSSLIAGLLLDSAGEDRLTSFYQEFVGDREDFGDIVRVCKLRIMENELAGDLNSLARDVARIARSNARTADFTQNVLSRALKEIIAVFPVYRTYIDEAAAPTAADRRDIDWAVAKARRYDSAIDASVFDFLHSLLTCDLVAKHGSGFSRTEIIRFVMRMQQMTGPVMAKGLEDTTFYRYGRMLGLNEVGGHPSEFRVSVAAFHHANQKRAKRFPYAMVSTSTHDSKHGEDARARLFVLSQRADEWTQNVAIWSRILRAGMAGSPDDAPPDRSDEYIFYQLLLGSWPPDLSFDKPDATQMEAFRRRLEGAMTKSIREAKVHTTWSAPNAAYEGVVLSFVRSALDASRKNAFLDSFGSFLSGIAESGMHNSLIQTVLKLSLPGVPDIYQGGELWDFNFVDPDNRRPVDYEIRRQKLRDLHAQPRMLPDEYVLDLMANWQDGRIKLLILSRMLALRRQYRSAFQYCSYEPLDASGRDAENICAFARVGEDGAIAVATLLCPGRFSRINPVEANLSLSGLEPQGTWTDLLSGRQVDLDGGLVAARSLFAHLPVAVLVQRRNP